MSGWEMSRRSFPAYKRHLHRLALAALALLISSSSYGAQKTIQWENGAQCVFETRFDPAKYDEQTLSNTIDLIFGDRFGEKPSSEITLNGPGGHLTTNTAEHQQACERKKEWVASLPLIDLPGIERYRKWTLDALEDFCRFDRLKARAAMGEPGALREFRSAPQCSSYIDALEGKTDIRGVWRNMINAECRQNSKPEECKANFFKAERKQSPEDAIKLDVLMFGWTKCSTGYLKANDFNLRDSMLKSLEKDFRRRFKVKASPCAD
jgi:hypothetical protein